MTELLCKGIQNVMTLFHMFKKLKARLNIKNRYKRHKKTYETLKLQTTKSEITKCTGWD